ncbi:MAG: hypothetical protein OEZ59_10860 [Deltaproteobacteria bacterium]|nr:hypothetical protein [Deltaproteobacteria bacterium]
MKQALMAARVVLALLALTLMGPAHSWADNDHKVVIGVGAGPYGFHGVDEAREDDGTFPDMDGGGTQHFYAEWYVLGNLGLGFQKTHADVSEVVEIGFFPVEKRVDLDINFITVHWVPYVSSSKYVRYIVVGGMGSANYTLSYSAINNVTYDTSGSAMMLGALVDWGDDGIGGRFGLDIIKTSLDPFDVGGNKVSADGSGNKFHLDLRYAFN